MASYEANNPPLSATAPLFHPQISINNNGQQQRLHQPLSPSKFPMVGTNNGLGIDAPWMDMNNNSTAPASAAPVGQFLSTNGGTVVSNSSSSTSNNTSVKMDPLHLQPRVSTTSILLPPSQQPRSTGGDAVTHPVPEFLCHLFSIVTDPALSHLISWSVPTSNEKDTCGGGRENIGKIVVHNPQGLQDYVLGKYYRHSRYSSFQRQLNYFGFKKKLHGGKKGKLCPCSYVHEGLGREPSSLFSLKRRLRTSGGKRGAARMMVNSQAKETTTDNANAGATTTSSPFGGNDSRRMSANAAASVSTTSSCLNNFQDDSSSMFTKLGELSAPPVNKAVIVKDSNHANFLTTLPYPPQMLPIDSTSSPTSNAPATAINMPLLPNNNNWVQSAGMAMPFPQHLQAEFSNFQQQLFNNHAAANGSMSCNVQVPPPSSVSMQNVEKDPSSKDFNTEITIARANEVAREAQKALERAYRKRKQETADENDFVVAPPDVKEEYQPQQQVQQQQVQQQQQQQVQQQQQQMLPLHSGFQKMMQQPVYAMMQNQQQMPPPSMDYSTGNDNQALNNFVPQSNSQTIDYASLGKQLLSQLNPQLLQGLNAQMGGFNPAAPSPAVTGTSIPSTATGMVAPFRTPGPPSNQPKQNNGSSSPIMFDDLFSKLLSTTLPPPEELFDDESSTGQLSDFDAELQALG